MARGGPRSGAGRPKGTPDTALSTAFDKAGFDHLKFDTAAFCRNFGNAGGTLDLWIEIGTAELMPGKGQRPPVAPSDQILSADARQPLSAPAGTGGGDHGSHVHQDRIRVVPAAASDGSRQSRAGEDQATSVHQDPRIHVPPAREPDAPMPDGGQTPTAINDGHGCNASVGRQMPSGGHETIAADRGHIRDAPARQPVAGGDQVTGVQQDRTGDVPSRTPAAREPSAADLKAMKEASDLTYFEMIKLRGKAWTQYRFKQLKNVRSLNMRENALINQVIDYQRTNRISDDRFIHLSIPSAEMKKMVRRIETEIQAKAELMVTRSKTRKRSHG